MLGQGKSLYGKEWTGSSQYLEFVDRSVASMTMANARSRQAQILGKFDEGRLRVNGGLMNNDVAAGALGNDDDANNNGVELNGIIGAQIGSGQDEMYGVRYSQAALTNSEELMWVAGAAVSYGQNDRFDVAAVEYDALNVNAHAAIKQGHLHALGEIFIREEDQDVPGGPDVSSFGWLGQASWTLDPGPTVQWGAGVRLSGVTIDDPGGLLRTNATAISGVNLTGDVFEFQVVGNAFYHGHELKTQVGYTLQNFDPDGASSATNHIIELQTQVVF
jgi:hypothetical protein